MREQQQQQQDMQDRTDKIIELFNSKSFIWHIIELQLGLGWK